ncbi:hypothetical protein [Micromonospora sp. WMMD980]|uniref:hypothetical protein n=1 Tax=Micromonospora sp. WMMD980 TaxID=3016088 RepID=UPI002417C491|nr:hypothetical protein [Micromonospora sp. WMMD980]MDG4798949.1 hypothetical protein [Micromonospora sp. WMMD980]MDG4798978.1 hypothetical protein [Micromonospora sp. WMMD980]MDG4799015.1 hypothetical protein [Micromonospora sp. WMMD980]
MTHPPSGPQTPPPPSGPRVPKVAPIDPDSPAGRAATEALSQALAEIQVAIWRRKAAAKNAAA